jgi:flagellar basal-body rod protein FlgB
MIDGIFNQPNYVAAKRLLDAVAVRQQAIASNIANVETPGYKRLDIDPSFAQALHRAAGSRDVAQLNSLHPTIAVDSNAATSRRDGNSVTLEDELLQLNRNYLDHLLDQQMVSSSLLKLRMAITGKPV